jgi:putative pre-16S rRNA nuclease
VRVLGVDFGERRIGLAVSDESGAIVVPVGVIARRSDEKAARAIAFAAAEREVTRIVVGLPRHADGSEGLVARRARNFAGRLAAASDLPVDLHPEGLTTAAAESELVAAGLPPDRRAAARDAEAAAVLLRDYLSVTGGAPA